MVHSTPFIGREDEIKTLERLFDTESKYLKTGIIDKLSIIGLHAEAGVGKSRLIHEFIKSKIDLDIDFFSIGTCSNISSQPYHLFISLIKDSFNISIIDEKSTIKEKLNKGVDHLINQNKNKKEQLVKSLPILSFLLGLPSDDSRIKNKDDIVNHIHISIRVLLEALCTKANKQNLSFIIILEDLIFSNKVGNLPYFSPLIHKMDFLGNPLKKREAFFLESLILKDF